MNSNVWTESVKQLSTLTARPIIALDLPGYGDSISSAENCTLQSDTLEDLVEWVAAQITSPSTIIGWSLGGLVATKLAIKYPNKVKSLGLISSSPKFVAQNNWPGIQPRVLSGFADNLNTDHQAVIERFMAIQAMGSHTAKQDIKQIKNAVLAKPTPSATVLQSGLTLLAEVDLRSELASLTMPVHLLLGRLDALVPVKMIQQLTEYTDAFEITVLEKASHAPFISDPEAYKDWFLELINLK